GWRVGFQVKTILLGETAGEEDVNDRFRLRRRCVGSEGAQSGDMVAAQAQEADGAGLQRRAAGNAGGLKRRSGGGPGGDPRAWAALVSAPRVSSAFSPPAGRGSNSRGRTNGRPRPSDVTPRKTKHISFVVCSPSRTDCGGLNGLLGFLSLLS